MFGWYEVACAGSCPRKKRQTLSTRSCDKSRRICFFQTRKSLAGSSYSWVLTSPFFSKKKTVCFFFLFSSQVFCYQNFLFLGCRTSTMLGGLDACCEFRARTMLCAEHEEGPRADVRTCIVLHCPSIGHGQSRTHSHVPHYLNLASTCQFRGGSAPPQAAVHQIPGHVCVNFGNASVSVRASSVDVSE